MAWPKGKPAYHRRGKRIKMFSVNGAWYPATIYGKRLLKRTGLQASGGFLSITVLAMHCAQFGIALDIDGGDI